MKWFLDVSSSQHYKYGQLVSGDVFLSRRIEEEDRIVVVLSDGLGSGIKANVLATLTATMAARFTSNYKDIRRTAEIIMTALPICKIRKINYATFSIMDIRSDGMTRIMEYDSPAVFLIRNNTFEKIDKQAVQVEGDHVYKKPPLQVSQFQAGLGDRIVFFSDGVTQSGMGTRSWPLGWGEEETGKFILERIRENPEISSRELATRITERAQINDLGQSKDDTTCGVVYFRKPRPLLVVSGPPIDPARDRDIGRIISGFSGKIALCGGTTANIAARELGRELRLNSDDTDPNIPPTSTMPGIDLVTEGILTLARTAELLEKESGIHNTPNNAARKLATALLESDTIRFVVGTKINDAHQDPNVPVTLDIRRNVIQKIALLLEKKQLKQVSLTFI